MPNPPPFKPGFSYTGYQAINPTRPLPGPMVDNDLANVANSINETITALSSVRRSDGQLANGLVTFEALASDLTIGIQTATAWVTAHAYTAGNTVVQTNKFYLCLVTHVSGVFATDLAAVKWVEVTLSITGYAADQILYDNGVSGLAATNIKTALDEIAASARLFKKTLVTASGTFTFDATTNWALVEILGAGGGGASGLAVAAKAAAGSGGGAGGFVSKFFSTVGIVSGAVVIGAAGAASANTNGAPGGNGGFSSWTDINNTLLAGGGVGGISTSQITTIDSKIGGAGGAASGGDINRPGDYGAYCFVMSINILAGGAAGIGRAGYGASSPYGAGGVANGAVSSTSGGDNSIGQAGTGFGSGGGGGGGVNSASGANGGAGTQGCAVIWEFK